MILQNAASKSQRLLAQMQRLHRQAIAALQAPSELAAAGAADAATGGGAHQAAPKLRAIVGIDGGADPVASSGAGWEWLDGEPSPGVYDVDVELDLPAATEQLAITEGELAAAHANSSHSGGGASEAPLPMPGGGDPVTPAPAANRDASALTPATAAVASVAPAAKTARSPLAPAAGAGTAGAAREESAADMVILMCALCGCATKESEMLVRA